MDFKHDLMPIVTKKCIGCHDQDKEPPLLAAGSSPAVIYARLLKRENAGIGSYVHAGRARTSPLIWHIYGRNTSRPWDGALAERAFKPIPSSVASPLTDGEKRTFVEWIDLGAQWTGEDPGESERNDRGESK